MTQADCGCTLRNGHHSDLLGTCSPRTPVKKERERLMNIFSIHLFNGIIKPWQLSLIAGICMYVSIRQG